MGARPNVLFTHSVTRGGMCGDVSQPYEAAAARRRNIGVHRARGHGPPYSETKLECVVFGIAARKKPSI